MNHLKMINKITKPVYFDTFDIKSSCKSLNCCTFNIKIEGIVEQVEGNIIHARTYSAEEDEWSELTFSVSDVPKDDHELIREGALFNLYLGYETTNGTRRKQKRYKFRRIKL